MASDVKPIDSTDEQAVWDVCEQAFVSAKERAGGRLWLTPAMRAGAHAVASAVCPPDSVVLPRAEVEALRRDQNTLDICTDAFARLHASQSALRVEYEALRARTERLRSVLSRLEPMMRLAAWYAVMDDLEPGDLADDLRDPQETNIS